MLAQAVDGPLAAGPRSTITLCWPARCFSPWRCESVACTGHGLATNRPSRSRGTTSPRRTVQPSPRRPSPHPSPRPSPQPLTAYGPGDPHGPGLLSLVPADARATNAWFIPQQGSQHAEIVVTWFRMLPHDLHVCGLVVWRHAGNHSSQAWRVIFLTRTRDSGSCGYVAAVGDLTHDHRSDVLTAKDLDGSGGCGWWR